MKQLIISFFISLFIWLLNLELNPSLGHIWLRPNDKGQIIFAWRSLIVLLKQPFKDKSFWLIKNWDINYYTLFLITYCTIKIISYIIY